MDEMKSGACEVRFDRQSIVGLSVECVWKCVDSASVHGLSLLHIYDLTTPRTHSHTTITVALMARSEQAELGQPHI